MSSEHNINMDNKNDKNDTGFKLDRLPEKADQNILIEWYEIWNRNIEKLEEIINSFDRQLDTIRNDIDTLTNKDKGV